jgi:hypothetical protein
METEYESLRESNIERNKKFLKDIGLESNVVRENAVAADSQRSKPQKGKRKRKLASETALQDVNSRRSLRIATLPAPSYKVPFH